MRIRRSAATRGTQATPVGSASDWAGSKALIFALQAVIIV
jgi:hypothetical protein